MTDATETTPTTTYRIEVWNRNTADPALQAQYQAAFRRIGVDTVEQCDEARLYFIRGPLGFWEATTLAEKLLADPVTEDYAVSRVHEVHAVDGVYHSLEVTLLPGVTDTAAESLLWAAKAIGIEGITEAATGQRYHLSGYLRDWHLRRIAESLFANPVIQRYVIDNPIEAPFVPPQPVDLTVEVIPVRHLAPEQLVALSKLRRLALNEAEMLAIQAYYQGEGRDPTDAELEMLAQTWSEHCVHKTFKARIDYTGPAPGPNAHTTPREQQIGSILGDYIRAATEELDRDWVRSAFVDNAGIVAYTDKLDLAFKVETHNHPSALEPFGGANTGIGGVIRDILGVSARPIANTDVLCFGPTDLPHEEVPEGALHPIRVERGVIAGIEDYGNKMGIPTVNGAILYDAGYISNPLVYCGSLGVLPVGSHPTEPQPGDLIVVVGGRTGRDGLRGATFSSMELDEQTAAIAGTAVQIGHPVHEKQVLEVVVQARDEKLYNAITDCGAGGLSSAVGEMGAHIGARVHLERVPLKYPGLRPWEIWLSEAQERMVLAVPPGNWPRLQQIAADHSIEAVDIGVYEPSGRLTLTFGEKFVGDLAMGFLHDGLPGLTLQAEWAPPEPQPVEIPHSDDLTPDLLRLLDHPNIRSKESVIRVYDHEVQGGTALKPLVGVAEHGPADAAVLVPWDAAAAPLSEAGPRLTGVVLSNGINPAYGRLDPYAMAWATVDEAMRNAVAVGANPDRIAILDNFCWGSPSLPDRLGSLVRCAQGCYDAALAYRTPFISGKDSLNNEYTAPDGTRHAIPGTLLISALGLVPNIEETVTSDFKEPGSLIYVVGVTKEELGGSHYAMLHGQAGGQVPQPVKGALAHMRGLYNAIRGRVVRACHDCSEGGLAVALAEMCIGGRLGAEVDLVTAPGASDHERSDTLLFSESLTRFLVEVHPRSVSSFIALLGDVPHAHIGRVTEDGMLRIQAWGPEYAVEASITDLEAAWRGIGPESISLTPTTEEPQDFGAPVVLPARPKVAILHARGTNRDRDAALACTVAGGDPEIVLVNHLLDGTKSLMEYGMLVIPGGFSFGDDLGAGQIWATTLSHTLGEQMARFIAEGRPTLGICNGFQVLVKAGLLPGPHFEGGGPRSVTLTYNESGRFECRWVVLEPNPASTSLFTEGLEQPIHCPVAHGEGRVMLRHPELLDDLAAQGLIALTYASHDYPGNPNGSMGAIAGLSNPAGNVLGLMPHPEDHIFLWQHPARHRGGGGGLGLRLFENGIRRA